MKNKVRKVVKVFLLITLSLYHFVTLSFAASSTVDVNIFVRPGHKIPPQSVTDLRATTGSKIGEIDLSWTAPQTTWDIELRWFYIRYSSLSVNDAPFLGDTTAWWNAANVYEISNWWKPGETVNLTIGNLIPAVTYYFSIKSEDEFGNISDFDTKTLALNQASARAGWDRIPPSAITTLFATPGDVEGEIKLSWLSPGDDGTTGNLTGQFQIKYSTDPTLSLYQLITLSTSCLSGSSQSYTVTGLTGGVTYYFRIWAADEVPNWSSISNGATSYAQLDVTPPSKITDLVAEGGYNEVKLKWTSPGDDGRTGDIIDGFLEIRYSTLTTLSTYQLITLSTSTIAGESLIYNVTGLEGDTTYYFRIRVSDEKRNFSEFSDIVSTWTLDNVPPEPVTFLEAIAGDREVQLIWSKSTSDDVSYYKLYRSTNFLSPYQLIGSTTSTFFTDTGLTNLVTYWYFVTAVDFYENESSSSPVVSAIPVTGDYLAPLPPYNIRAEIVNNKFRISWSAPSYNEDGSQLEDLAGFRIYTSTNLWSKGNLIVEVSSSTNYYDFDISTFTSYYRITAIDDATPKPNESDISFAADSNKLLYFIKENFVITFPEIIQEDLKDFAVELDTIPAETQFTVFSSEIKLVKGVNFKDEVTKMFNYPEVCFDYYYGKNNKAIRRGISLDNFSLSFYWFNGLKWVMVGGDDNKDEGKITLKTRRFGKYEIRYSYRSSKFVLHTVYPRIFTPNGDGKNDIIEFQYENPEGFAPTGKIFDLKGRFITNLRLGPDSSSTSGSLIWDGKDLKGNICESGVYIYQIEAGGEVFNGTIILAK